MSERPIDIFGKPVEFGKWYWALSRTRKVSGAGKFAATIGRPDDITFFINGAGYSPESFMAFEPAIAPNFEGIELEPTVNHTDKAARALTEQEKALALHANDHHRIECRCVDCENAVWLGLKPKEIF